MSLESQLIDPSYHRQVAFDALESNYENVIASMDSAFEEAYQNFRETVVLAQELLPESDHATVMEIGQQLDQELLEHGITPPATGGNTVVNNSNEWGASYYVLGAMIILAIIVAVYKWKSSRV